MPTTTIHPNTEKLRKIMVDHAVSPAVVAELMNRSIKTVYCWRAQSPLPITNDMLELLEFKLNRTAQGTH